MKRVRAEAAVRWGVTAAVIGIGAAAGFTHTHDAAVRAGQTGWLAWADAVVIESMVVGAGLQLAKDLRAGRSVRLAGTVLAFAFLIQMGSQVSGAPATFAGWLFAGLPALGCLVMVKFALRAAGEKALASEPEPRPEVRVERIEPQVQASADEPVQEIEAPKPAAPANPEPVWASAGAPSWPPR